MFCGPDFHELHLYYRDVNEAMLLSLFHSSSLGCAVRSSPWSRAKRDQGTPGGPNSTASKSFNRTVATQSLPPTQLQRSFFRIRQDELCLESCWFDVSCHSNLCYFPIANSPLPLSYNRYLSVAAGAVRRSLKEGPRLKAEIRGTTPELRFAQWKVGIHL